MLDMERKNLTTIFEAMVDGVFWTWHWRKVLSSYTRQG